MTRRTTVLSSAVALAAALALTGCSSGGGKPELRISGAYMPQPVMDIAGGFLTIKNTGGSADRLTSVTSTVSDDVTMHETKGQTMRRVESFDIPAGGELKLARGGNHLMFMELKKKPKQGEKVSIELHFEKTGPIEVDVPVEVPNYNPQQR
ncbi:copper chaperone PCu(A)C [Streptomyces termitum]|uniref:copper chaperone PCu(A)C n=1 Tax=Streptomyces termitum TaxID=67368 RepID=UPI0033AC0B5E